MVNLFQQNWPFGDLVPNSYGLIMADPPWRFANYSKAGEAKSPSTHYECQDLGWIKSLPVETLAADDCLLWLWATNPMLSEAFQVLREWCFTFKTAGTWVKRTKHGRDAFGTGYILRSSNEPFLIGTRGKPVTARNVRTLVRSGEVNDDDPLSDIGFTVEAVAREHSRKPDEAFQAAERLIPAAKRVELFSRQPRTGWDVWGNETTKFEGTHEQHVDE